MSAETLLVDGRVLDDDHPGVQRFWLPILCAWAARGHHGLVAYQRDHAPQPTLVAAGFRPVELRHGARHPLGVSANHRAVQRTGARVALSPLYLTVTGSPRAVATVFDITGRTHARSLRSRMMWELTMRRTLRAANIVVCATAAAARELETALPAARGRTAVVSAIAPVPPQPNDSLLAQWSLPQPYVLTISSHRPHKRLAELKQQWMAAPTDIPLVIAGAGTAVLNAPPRVYGLGYVSDAAAAALLARAACLVSASVAEGFGLPILAALAGGIPVVATRQPALAEVASDAALWCATSDLPGLVQAAVTVAHTPSVAHGLITRGYARARAFHVDRALEELERVLNA